MGVKRKPFDAALSARIALVLIARKGEELLDQLEAVEKKFPDLTLREFIGGYVLAQPDDMSESERIEFLEETIETADLPRSAR
jgi:hypothetical protein